MRRTDNLETDARRNAAAQSMAKQASASNTTRSQFTGRSRGQRSNPPSCAEVKASKLVRLAMASRDLTASFQERRSAANMRRRKAGDGGRMKPFGKIRLPVHALLPERDGRA
mmetsp:Transcript_23101/g.48110  ORF Transcript_23101/g.48110 Transcript_23101/m.48110 type:complete len:112 (+) Transcript_23101:96-431(+)